MSKYREYLELGLFEQGVPPEQHEELLAYVMQGTPTGGFLHMLLCEASWKAVIGKADRTNQQAIHTWAAFFYNYLPRCCYGSAEEVQRWIMDKDGYRTEHLAGLERIYGE